MGMGIHNGMGARLSREAVAATPAASARSIARRLVQEHPLAFAHVKAAVTQVTRAKKQLLGYKPKRCVGMPKYNVPQSRAEAWEPVVLGAPCTVLSLSDIHVPFHDARAITAAVKHTKQKHKTTVLLVNGDLCDFYSLSRFETSKDKRDFQAELYASRQLLGYLKQEFPKARRIFKRGNHEDWFDKYLNNRAPEMASVDFMQLGKALDLDKFGFEEVRDNIIMAGELPIMHGHEFKNNSGVNPSRSAFLKTNHSSLSGHLHRTSSHSESDMFHKEVMTWTQGCLCGRRPEYARVNKWNLGFAVVEVAKNGAYDVFNYRIGTGYKVRAA